MSHLQSSPARASRSGSITPIALFGVVALSLIGFSVYMLNSAESSAAAINPILASVERGEFVARVLDQGEIQSSENIEIRCEVRRETALCR